jgi:two-component system sensor histidine kinase KdpD
MPQTRQILRSALVLLRGVVLLAAVTAFSYHAGLNSASAALLYLIAVVLQSLDCNFSEAAAVSLLAVGCLNYFFMDPPFSLAVAHPLDVVTLICLLVTSLVITRIQRTSRAEAQEAKLRRANMERLYKLGQELLALPEGTALGPAILRPILSAFDLAAVCVFDAGTLGSYGVGTSRADLAAKTRSAFISERDAAYPEDGVVVRCLRARHAILGAVGFEGLNNPELTAAPLTALVTAAVERSRSFQSAADAAAHAQAELLRSAILDALAHEIKTPLATILTAAGGIRAAGSMQPQQAELTEMIETEASRLGELTSRLLRLARLDSEEVKPRLEPVDAAELAQKSVRRYSKIWPDRQISFRRDGEIPDTPVDSELILLAMSQLLENACKYSRPDARVSVDLKAEGATAVITIWNDGAPIPANERGRIFDRFYRGTAARRISPGSGLGLFVARKIALAHGGDLALVDTGAQGVGFRLTIPAVARAKGAGGD